MIHPSGIRQDKDRELKIVNVEQGLYTVENAYEGVYEYFKGRPVTGEIVGSTSGDVELARQLRIQYDAAKENGWANTIKAVAKESGHSPELCWGIASSEPGVLWSPPLAEAGERLGDVLMHGTHSAAALARAEIFKGFLAEDDQSLGA
jgi:hypothetical protein